MNALRAQQVTLVQDELLDAIHWMRTVLALIAGIVWGLIPLQGLNAFIGCACGWSSHAKWLLLHAEQGQPACRYAALNLGSVFVWYRRQDLDEEEYGGAFPLLSEGFAPGQALFTVRKWLGCLSCGVQLCILHCASSTCSNSIDSAVCMCAALLDLDLYFDH